VIVIIVAVCVGLIHVLAIVPYRNNILKRMVENRFDRLFAATGKPTSDLSAAATIRRDIDTIERALRYDPTDIDLHVELAAEYWFLGRLDDAERAYRTALRFDRRPEIYRNLSELEFERGHVNEAVDSYSYAVAFYPPLLVWAPEQLQAEIIRRARARYGPSAAMPAQ
jgi:tetratricopeptide (TPR) repeat protein